MTVKLSGRLLSKRVVCVMSGGDIADSGAECTLIDAID
jgi:hypothetical protein